jgi:uncharacterized protein YhfF
MVRTMPVARWLTEAAPLLWDVAQRLARLIAEGRKTATLASLLTAEEQRSLVRAVARERKRREIAAKH